MKINIEDAIDYVTEDVMRNYWGNDYKEKGITFKDSGEIWHCYTIKQVILTFIEYLKKEKEKQKNNKV